MKQYNYIYLIFILNFIACDNFLDIEPTGQVIPKSIEDYRAFLTTAYSTSKDYKVLTTYRGDELALKSSASGVEQYKDIFIWNDLNPSPLTRSFPYASLYNTIFYANHIINNASTIEGNQIEVNQLVGEAYALRAMHYFELANMYAKPYNKTSANVDLAVPITTAYDSEKTYATQTVEKVYALIISDIEKAENLINIDTQLVGYNYRFSKIAVKALKTRIYLYQQEWQKAIDAANEVLILNSTIQNLNTTSTIMPSEYNSVESILAMETIADFDLVNNASISNGLINAYNPLEDLRFSIYFSKNLDGTYNSKKSADVKFKSSFRTSEVYLTIAECLVQLNKVELAKEQLINFTKYRYTLIGWEAYKLKVASLSSTNLLTEILEERRREFAIEGHRWNDLKRTTQQEITKTFEGISYKLEKNDDRYVIPFPNDAVINNPFLK
ncbi:MAG: RagB/SusD family nutrient uptake outer membrane protein [Lutibacter sp.]|nr:RagB/SusD family nutrient uptake outer membrane protein [Lutibacter sp.]